jgi:2-polyprenyl-6-methoxyphenol hydroxylase-like FAD-dependent oxidoreductase
VTHVLISGASIAGPALAFWLHRFGLTATVVERSPGPRPGGQAVDIRGVAREVVARMGLADEVRAARTLTTGVDYVTRNDRRIGSLSADALGGDGLLAEIEILRGDLSDVLVEATRDTTEYVYGDRVMALEEDAGGVVAEFESGGRRRFDVVVGADGLHSGVRAVAFGAGHGTREHLGHYLAFLTVPNHRSLDRRMVAYAEPGRSAAIRSVHDNTEAMAFLSFRSEPLDVHHRDSAAHRRILRERLAGMAWEVPWLLERLDEAPDLYFDACTQLTLDAWSRGRVVLLGDAGYCPSPLSGQGTSVALVAAYVLAAELASRPGDHAGAFAAYERKLRSYVAANQKVGRDNARMTNPTNRFALGVQMAFTLGLTRMPGSTALFRRMMRPLNDVELPALC